MPRALHRFTTLGRFAALLAIPVVVRADITRFDLSGTVTDGTGAVLPGVTVTNVLTVNNIIGLDPAKPSATFGTVTGVRDQRQAQIAVRYRF